MISICIPFVRPYRVKFLTNVIKKYSDGLHYELLMEEDKERIGCPKMLKRLVQKAQGRYIVFMGDDTIPAPGFLTFALEDMKKNPEGNGLVGFSDMTGRKLPTHWMANIELLPMLDGEFFHTGYTHCCCDVELMQRCLEMGRYIWSEKAVVLHEHPLIDGSDWDADYRRVYSEPIRSKDQALLAERRSRGWK